MNNKTSILMMVILASALSITTVTANAADAPKPEQVVAGLQKLFYYEMFCQSGAYDLHRTDAVTAKVGKKLEAYFSKEFHRLFMWAECGKPDTPPHYDGSSARFSDDIRYAYITEEGMETPVVHVLPATFQGADKAVVKVRYALPRTDELTAIYTLIREDANWRIDDISHNVDFKPDEEDRSDDRGYQHIGGLVVRHSDSIKADMQKQFHLAEEFYSEEGHFRSDIEKLMTDLLQLRHYDLSCRDKQWKRLSPVDFGERVEPYFSKGFIKSLLWSQCGEPPQPPHYANMKNTMSWDIRFGFGYIPITGAALFEAKNIKVSKASLIWPDKATVSVVFGYSPLNSSRKLDHELASSSFFKLVREDGRWKIDDIETHPGWYLIPYSDGVKKKDLDSSERDIILKQSFSIKDDMSRNYHDAEYERYKREQSKEEPAKKESGSF